MTENITETVKASPVDTDWGKEPYIETDAFLIEFNSYLTEIGIHGAFTQYYDSNYISIWVPSVDDVFLAKKILESQAENVIDTFFRLAKKHELILTDTAQQENWSTFCVTQVYSYEIRWMDAVVRKSKDEIREALATQLNVVPKYIFCHSENSAFELLPGYTFCFENPEQLSLIDVNMRSKIHQLCSRILSQNDKTGFCSKYQPGLFFFDAITRAHELYLLSRED